MPAAAIRVAVVQVEALEGVGQVVRRKPDAGVLDEEQAWTCGDADRPACRRRSERILDQVGDDLQDAVGVGDGARRRGGADRIE